MGNPETLTDDNLEFLKNAGIVKFQMSLDGMEQIHDFYRGNGNFKRTVDGLDRLAAHKINGTVMFTLTNENKNDLLPLIDFVAENTSARSFAFDLVCGVGNARDINTYISKEEMLSIYEKYQAKREELIKKGSRLKITEKSALFRILNYRSHTFYPYECKEFTVANGCYVGYSCFTILSDGSVAACRRFPEIIGKMPEQSFEEIFLGSPLLRKFRRAESYERCGKCRMYKYCRGCPAETYGFYGDPFRENLHCFVSEALPEENIFADEVKMSAPMDISYEDELKLVKSTLQNSYVRDYDKFINDKNTMALLGMLLSDQKQRTAFLSNPDGYAEKYAPEISSRYLAYICYYFDCLLRGKVFNPVSDGLDLM